MVVIQLDIGPLCAWFGKERRDRPISLLWDEDVSVLCLVEGTKMSLDACFAFGFYVLLRGRRLSLRVCSAFWLMG
jgi:hypothetical protein